jgi:hypothetical protein
MSQDQVSQARKHPTLKSLIALTAIMVMFGAAASGAQAANSISLGSANSFAVLGGSAVTNTGTSFIDGNVGVSPLTSVSGFPPGVITGGTIHAADGVADGAQSDLTIAYDNAAGQSTDVTLSADPVGSTLAPGVYTAPASLGISGDVTLDGGGDPHAVFVFQAGSSLIAASGTRILLQNGAQACNVFWQVSSSATIGTGSNFAGNILALTSIGMDTGATLDGRVLARNGAVTLDDNVINKSTCATPTSGDTTATTGAGQPVSVQLVGGDTTGANVTYTITGQPANGTLGPIDQATGTVIYTPNPGYTGGDSFIYETSSTNGTSPPATATITVTPLPPTGTNPPPKVTPPVAGFNPKPKQKKKLKKKPRRKAPRRPPAFTG